MLIKLCHFSSDSANCNLMVIIPQNHCVLELAFVNFQKNARAFDSDGQNFNIGHAGMLINMQMIAILGYG